MSVAEFFGYKFIQCGGIGIHHGTAKCLDPCEYRRFRAGLCVDGLDGEHQTQQEGEMDTIHVNSFHEYKKKPA